MGWKKERRENMDQNEHQQCTPKKGKEEKKKHPNKKRVYVLYAMVVTAPTFHAERSPLKAPAL